MDSSYDNDTVWKRQRLTKYVKTTKWRIAENNGRTYYYDKNEMKSQWDKPKEIEEFELSLEQELINRKQVLLSERVASPTVDDNSVGSNKDDKDRDNHYGSDYDRDRDEDRDGDRYESEDGDAMDVDSYGKHQSYGDSDKEENYHMQGNETADNDSDHTDYGDDNYGFDNDSHYGSDRGDNDSYQSDNSEKSDHHSPAINEDKGDSQPNSSTKVDAAIAVIATKVVDEALLLEQEKSSMLKKLSLPDSVLELGAYETGATCTQKFQIPPATVVKSFIDSYVGYPAMCQLVLELMNHTDNIINNSYTKSTATKGTTGMKHSSNSRTTSVVEKADTAKNISSNDDWLAFVTQDNVDSGSDKKNDKDVSQSNPFHTKNESRVVDIICNIIKEKFDVRASDQLLMKLTSTPPWLVSLMEDSTYRSLLLELADSHSDSAFLRLCLKELSMKGYNKEISRVMKDPEHFEVLNNILSDLLPEIMTVIDYHSYQEGMASIRTIGTSVEYGFFYLIELLKSISKKLKQRIGVVDTVAGKRKREEDGGKKENNLRQLINIFHRCQESLELSVIWNREDENSGDNVFPVNKNYQLDKLNLFALRTLGSLVLSNTINDIHEKAIVSELLDVLKSKSFDKIHIQRIHDAVFRQINVYKIHELTAMEKSVIAGNIHHLQHQYFVIRLVDLYLKNESVDDKLVRLLGILCISSAETDNSSGYSTESYVDNQNTNNLVWEKYQNVTEALEKLKSLFNSVTTNLKGTEKIAEKNDLIVCCKEHSMLSFIVLRWLEYSLADNGFTEQTYFLHFIPWILDIITTVATLYPPQMLFCLGNLKKTVTIIRKTAISSASTKGRISSQFNDKDALSDAIECLVYLLSLDNPYYGNQLYGYIKDFINSLESENNEFFFTRLFATAKSLELRSTRSCFVDLLKSEKCKEAASRSKDLRVGRNENFEKFEKL